VRRVLTVGVRLLADVAGGFAVPRLHGQDHARPKALVFEVASIKQNMDAGATPAWVLEPGGGLTITACSLFQLIAIAYDSNAIQTRDQIVGGPAWLKADRFDIRAKANGSLNGDETGRPTRLLAMLRSLLEDRVKLRNLVPPDSSRWCGWRGFGTGRYTIQGLTMENVARGLASAWEVSRPALDR